VGSESSDAELHVVKVRQTNYTESLGDRRSPDQCYSATAPEAWITNELVLLIVLALPVISVVVTIVIFYLLTHKGDLRVTADRNLNSDLSNASTR